MRSDLVPEEAPKCVGLEKYFNILSNVFMVLNLCIIIFIIRVYEIRIELRKKGLFLPYLSDNYNENI